ncbi:hypothetical protein [Kineococcus sp. SYSU DK004]|uniref:hypothetical protein n=1 Tax=Kineococcus sp. SYSU DK004 TaxID=3383125 RepID=UPI003D7EA86E
MEASSAEPRQYVAELLGALLRCSLPAAGTLGGGRAALVRSGRAPQLIAASLRTSPTSRRPDFDRIRQQVTDRWGEFAAFSDRLPAEPPELSMAFARRSFGWLAFAFGGAGHPLVVCKVASGRTSALEREARVLQELRGYPFAPRHLGVFGATWVQEGVAGLPLRLQPLPPGCGVGDLAWDLPVQGAVGALVELARRPVATAARAEQDAGVPSADGSWMSSRTRAEVVAALGRVREGVPGVVRHSDMGPQNSLDVRGDFRGFIDWETGTVGTAGMDVLQLVLSIFEQRTALRTFDEATVLERFRAAWTQAPLFREGRRAVGRVLSAAGAPPGLAPDVAVAFFHERLHQRVLHPSGFLVSRRLAAGMLEHVVSAPAPG